MSLETGIWFTYTNLQIRVLLKVNLVMVIDESVFHSPGLSGVAVLLPQNCHCGIRFHCTLSLAFALGSLRDTLSKRVLLPIISPKEFCSVM
jgi:hypothetical protein